MKFYFIFFATFLFCTTGLQAQFSLWDKIGNNTYNTNLGGNLGIGTPFPQQRLDVNGNGLIQGGLYAMGRVGIGTTSPAHPLDVVGNARVDGNTFFVNAANNRVGIGTASPGAALHIKQPGTDIEDGLRLQTSQGTGEDWYFFMDANDDFVIRNDVTNAFIVQKNTGNVGIGTQNPDQRLHVVGSGYINGNLGIGTAAPTTKLHVYESAASTNAIRLTSNGSDGMPRDMLTISTPGFQSNDNALPVIFKTDNAFRFSVDGGNNIDINDRGNIGIKGPALLGGANYAMIIHGNPNSSGVPNTYGLKVEGGVAVTGSVNCTGGTCSSDLRWKKDIQPLENALDKLDALRGVSYFWRTEAFPDRNFGAERQIGVIAQEVEAVYPDLVKTDDEGYKSMDYMSFTAVLLEAVKELKTENEKLEKQLEDLDVLKADMAKIQALLQNNTANNSSGNPAQRE